MSLSALAHITEQSNYDMVSTDLFDTVLLRDRTSETERLAWAAHRSARQLGVDPRVVVSLRWALHSSAYQAVAIERPAGEASLMAICRTMAAALGLGEEAAQLLRRTEVEVDCEHLQANRPLLELFERARRASMRVIAVSDTYYNEDDLRTLLSRVVGDHPFTSVYSSSDIGLTKHSGCIFAEVARQEGVDRDRIIHVGDNRVADVERPAAAGWSALHLPRSRAHAMGKRLGRVRALPTHLRRVL